MRTKTVKSLNSLVKEIMGKPMTPKEKKPLKELRDKVARKEITVAEGHKIWDAKVLHKHRREK